MVFDSQGMHQFVQGLDGTMMAGAAEVDHAVGGAAIRPGDFTILIGIVGAAGEGFGGLGVDQHICCKNIDADVGRGVWGKLEVDVGGKGVYSLVDESDIDIPLVNNVDGDRFIEGEGRFLNVDDAVGAVYADKNLVADEADVNDHQDHDETENTVTEVVFAGTMNNLLLRLHKSLRWERARESNS